MKFNDTAPPLPKPDGPPPWLDRLALNATLEATVLKRPVEGREVIRALLKESIPLYDFQEFTNRGPIGEAFFMESYRASVQGTPIEVTVWVHLNEAREADSLVISHRPLEAALLFSRLVWERVGNRYGDLYLTGPQADALGDLSSHQSSQGYTADGSEVVSK